MKTDLAITKMPIEKLKPAEYNPRVWTEAARKALTASLDEFGFMQPLVVNTAPGRNGIVVGGNFKLDIATKRGLTELPVVLVHLTLAKEKELNLRLNKNQGEFDLDLLKEFDPAMLYDVGFDSKELDKIYKGDGEDDFNADAEAAAIVEPTTKLGDIFQLGRHKLMCGATGDGQATKKLMGGVQADMVFTDPPYNVNYKGAGKNTSTTIENDNMSEEDFRKNLGTWFADYYAFTKPEAPLYCCYASRTHREFEDALNANGYEVRNQIIWVKKVASMGWGDYRWKHEPMFYCFKRGQSLEFYGDRKQYTEWTEEPSDEELLKTLRAQVKKDEEGGSTVWRLAREQKYDHPTQKPIKLVSIAIRNSSKRDDVVLDLFGGSGSTLIAAEQLNRTCYTMELDPKYCDVIIKRWEKLTGGKAVKQ